jgi:hypothetical protein
VRTSNSRGSSRPDSKLKKADVAVFEKVMTQLADLRDQIAVLSKSKPDGLLNVFKLQFVNEKLAEANKVLVGEYKPFASFDAFDADNLPSNSDVVLVLSQYLTCLERWRSSHVYQSLSDYKWYWRVEDGAIEAAAATKSGD